MRTKFFFLTIAILIFFPLISSAHYIVGYVDDALDGTISNGHSIVVWNETNGVQDNVTDIVGVSGNSNVDRMYLVDCELLNIPCQVGDELSVRVYDNGDNYVSFKTIKVNVTGAGYDFANNLTLNSPLIFNSLVVDDSSTLFSDEIDLIAASTRKVFCNATVEDLDGGHFGDFYSEFYGETSSFYGDSDDNNYHHTNSSCFFDSSYGNENESFVSCSFDVWYYANSESWNCAIRGDDTLVNSTGGDTTNMNQLLSIELQDEVTFSVGSVDNVSFESEVVVYNRGNVLIDLALSGYSVSPGDGNAMSCTNGENISVENQKYNLTSSTSGILDFSEFNNFYTNLTSSPFSTDFNLGFRTDDFVDNAYNSTFWRIYVPAGASGQCSGNVIFGAVVST